MLRDLIKRIENSTGGSREIDELIAKTCCLPESNYTSSVDAVLVALDEHFPEWSIDRACDQRVLYGDKYMTVGYQVELVGGFCIAIQDAKTRPLAYCAALVSAYQQSVGMANELIFEALSELDAPEVVSDVKAFLVAINLRLSLPEMEEDEGMLTLRWFDRDKNTFSFTFSGKGQVIGCLTHDTEKRAAWKLPISDIDGINSHIDEVVYEIIRR